MKILHPSIIIHFVFNSSTLLHGVICTNFKTHHSERGLGKILCMWTWICVSVARYTKQTVRKVKEWQEGRRAIQKVDLLMAGGCCGSLWRLADSVIYPEGPRTVKWVLGDRTLGSSSTPSPSAPVSWHEETIKEHYWPLHVSLLSYPWFQLIVGLPSLPTGLMFYSLI